MNSLYSKYIKERENFDIVETAEGFATYKCADKECYIRDIYVIPESRQTNVASQLADKISVIARARGCAYLVGTVAPEANNATASLKVLLSYGFKLIKSDTNLIYFAKEL